MFYRNRDISILIIMQFLSSVSFAGFVGALMCAFHHEGPHSVFGLAANHYPMDFFVYNLIPSVIIVLPILGYVADKIGHRLAIVFFSMLSIVGYFGLFIGVHWHLNSALLLCIILLPCAMAIEIVGLSVLSRIQTTFTRNVSITLLESTYYAYKLCILLLLLKLNQGTWTTDQGLYWLPLISIGTMFLVFLLAATSLAPQPTQTALFHSLKLKFMISVLNLMSDRQALWLLLGSALFYFLMAYLHSFHGMAVYDLYMKQHHWSVLNLAEVIAVASLVFAMVFGVVMRYMSYSTWVTALLTLLVLSNIIHYGLYPHSGFWLLTLNVTLYGTKITLIAWFMARTKPQHRGFAMGVYTSLMLVTLQMSALVV